MSPMIGVVNPSHYEKSHNKYGRAPDWLGLDETLEKSLAANPKWSPWVYELVNAALQGHQERGARLSTTALNAPCPRAEVLKRKVDYIGSLDDIWLPTRGTMIHRSLESFARQASMAEWRFYTTVDGIELSCSPDLLTETALYDWKVTDSPPQFSSPYRHHTEQVEVNAFICRHAEKWDPPGLAAGFTGSKGMPFDPRETPVRHVVLVYLTPKGPKVLEVERMQEYVTAGGVTREGKRPCVWPDAEVLDWLRPRLHIMQAALESYPDWPEPVEVSVKGKMVKVSAEEVWGGDEGWACPGFPLCKINDCLARRYPDGLVWPKPEEE